MLNYFLASFSNLLAYFATIYIKKRLFNKAFITQKIFAFIELQEKINLSFRQCLYNTLIKINKSWRSKFYNLKIFCKLKTIFLQKFFFCNNSFVLNTKHISLLAKKLCLKTSWHINNKIIKEQIGII